MRPDRQLYLLYADLLEYPTQSLKRRAQECAGLLSEVHPLAGQVFAGFEDWVNKESPGQVEEIFTSTFDLQGMCCPYVGHYLFGDNYQRSWFMARLNQGFREKGFSCGTELPDHVAAILRFLALSSEDEFSLVLQEEGLAPSVEKMVAAFDENGEHPYGRVLKSLSLLLKAAQVAGKDGLDSAIRGGSGND